MAVSYRTPEDILSAYDDGVEGWIDDPASRESLLEDGVVEDGLNYGSAAPGSGKGKRVQLYRLRDRFEPGSFVKEPQDGPDCTAKGSANAVDMTRAAEIIILGEPESYFARTASEPFYRARGHRGAGSDPGRLTRFAKEFGFLARQNYPGVIDLTNYNFKLGDKMPESQWQDVKELCRQHNANRWIAPRSISEAMDAMSQGWGIHSGQRLGFKKEADSRGLSPPITVGRGAWNHDVATGGYDDTKEIWPMTVFFLMNSWAKWNKKPKMWDKEVEAILGPWVPGMMVTTEEIYEQYCVGSGSIYAFADVNGYPQRELPDLGMVGW